MTCVTCELEIVGRPEFHVGLPFCCAGCVAGGPCSCSYDLLDEVHDVLDEARRAPLPDMSGISRI